MLHKLQLSLNGIRHSRNSNSSHESASSFPGLVVVKYLCCSLVLYYMYTSKLLHCTIIYFSANRVRHQPDEALGKLRLQRFHQKVVISTRFVQPENLPPTSSAVKYHSLRVYLQLQVWKGNQGLVQVCIHRILAGKQ